MENNGLNTVGFGSENTSIQPTKDVEVAEYTQKYKAELRSKPEVQALTNKINIQDTNTILTFGKEASEGISKVSDSLLNSLKMVNAEEAGAMIIQLTKIMDKFDIKDFQEMKEPSVFQKLLGKAKNAVELMFQKYDTMGSEVDKIYITLKGYERDIDGANKQLKSLKEANIKFYQELEKYVVAGEIAIEELDNNLIPEFQRIADESQNQLDVQNVQTLIRARDMIDQRVYDLKIAENIAIQTIPMVDGMTYGNSQLTRKINSAFVVTLPIFKQCLTQAVMLKRQELQAKSLKALDDKTNEILIKNAQMMTKQSTEIAKMAGKSSIKMETLEQTWSTIMQGIEDTKNILEQNKQERANDGLKLDKLKYDMNNNKKNF